MKPFISRTLLTAFFILAAQEGRALANPIYFDFQSQVYPVPSSGQTSNGYSVNFTPAPPAGQGEAEIDAGYGVHVAGTSSVNIAIMGWTAQPDPSNIALNGSPSLFNAQPFKLVLSLTDEASRAQGTLYFQGTFSGEIPTYTGGTLRFAPSIQTLVLGHNTYTVDLSHQTSWVAQQTWMMMAGFGGAYDVAAQVTVQPLPVQSAPEPTSLTLAGLGLAMVLGGRLHRNGAGRKPKRKQLKGSYPSSAGTLRDT